MTANLALAAALYFDHELASDPTPLIEFVRWLPAAGLRQWSPNAKPQRLALSRLTDKIKSGRVATVGVETESGDLTVIAATEALATLSLGAPPRAWNYDLVVSASAAQVARIGQPALVAALCQLAGALDATAGVVLWSPSQTYARALSYLASGPDLTPAQMQRMTDDYFYRSRWGAAIRRA